MSDVENALSKVSGEHQTALNWFLAHVGQILPWSTIKDHANLGARLVNQAKGIYKPHFTDYALSVRQTLSSPYADREIIRRPDGSWVYPYFQENANPADRDKEATNRGLTQCMLNGVPVGALLQVKPKPGVEYLVLGLAAVTDWKDGYFILEGYSGDGVLRASKTETDAAHDFACATSTAAAVANFDPTDIADFRERQMAEVIRRRGQAKFRAALIAAYSGKCVITGCDAVEALEAAHISPYKGSHTDHPQNGLLLRADIHSLFDLGLLSIDPQNMTVMISDQLKGTIYAQLAGRTLSNAKQPALMPNLEALRQHLEWTGIASKYSKGSGSGAIKLLA